MSVKCHANPGRTHVLQVKSKFFLKIDQHPAVSVLALKAGVPQLPALTCSRLNQRQTIPLSLAQHNFSRKVAR